MPVGSLVLRLICRLVWGHTAFPAESWISFVDLTWIVMRVTWVVCSAGSGMGVDGLKRPVQEWSIVYCTGKPCHGPEELCY